MKPIGQTIRWGLMSTGLIAQQFAASLAYLPDAECVAVGSRDQAKADAFGEQHNIPKRHGSYEALVNDPDVDVIYIGTPHSRHAQDMKLALEAGKHVLCEKAFTINAAQAQACIALARERGLFLMEAMWTRFLPAVVRLRELLAAGTLGELRFFRASFNAFRPFEAEHRLFNPELGGGALLDLGVYPIAFASMVLGQPDHIASVMHMGASDVDEMTGMVFSYEGAQMAVLSCAFNVPGGIQEAVIEGTEGHIHLPENFYRPQHFVLKRGDQPEERIELPYEGPGYQHEAAEVHRCLRAGLTESPVMPLDETLRIMATMDSIRARWGLKYPGE